MLLVVNRLRSFVFLMIHQVALARSQFAAIHGAHILNFAVQVRLLIFQMRRLRFPDPPSIEIAVPALTRLETELLGRFAQSIARAVE